MNARSLQEWVHWLEVGAGGRWVTRAAIVLGVILLSLRIGYTQFHGPLTEQTLAQAVVARQLAAGEGFTTLVNYPQTVAWQRKRADALNPAKPFEFDPTTALPELHQAPFYPAVMAAALRLFPEVNRAALFNSVPKPPDGFRADYVLLVLNIGLLWLAAVQTFALARRLFNEPIGLLAALGLLFSTSVWSDTVALSGMPLMMVLLLAFFQMIRRIDEAAANGKLPYVSMLAAGVFAALMFLTDYAAGLIVAAASIWVCLRFFGRGRAVSLAVLAAGFLVVAGPWMIRNVAWTGNPMALAWQGITLKAGDSTAEPAVARATFTTISPAVDLNKLGNKILTSLQVSLRERLWSGGGLFFAAFFVTGLVYRFRDERVNQLRWFFVATLGLLMVAQAFFDSGEGERLPIVYATPLIVIFGAGFFSVLVASHETLHRHAIGAAAILLLVQALPLARDVIAPRRGFHFAYPPYFPGLFISMREEMKARGGRYPAWSADVPAGAAWYSGQRVWAQPATLRDFYQMCQEQPQIALMLTPHTLDRPFFGMLTKREAGEGRLSDWSEVYTGLVTSRFPSGFPLSLSQKVADNFYLLIDPLAMREPVKR